MADGGTVGSSPHIRREEGVNVLKPHLRITIETLLTSGASQHEITRRTDVDHKTIRRYAAGENSPGGHGAEVPLHPVSAPMLEVC